MGFNILTGHHRPDQFTSVTTKMFKLLSKTWILLLTLALISTLAPIGKQNFVNAEDPLEDEIDNNEADEEVAAEDINVADEDVKTDEYDDFKLGSSPDAETTILFTKPAGSASDLPAGKVAEFLIGFSNKGNQEMLIESVEAAFHYPMDHTFVIQNFSAIHYNKVVKPLQQATVGYSFLPAEPFAGRPFGLSINVAYSSEGRVYSESVFNETVNIVEVDEGLDGETFFLYVFFAAGIVLLLVLGQQALSSMGKRRGGAPRVETGTTRNSGNVSDDGIDYDWLPKETLNELNKSPKGSPRRSPRLRKSKAGSGSE